MKKQLAKFAQAAVLGLAITFTACEEKGSNVKLLECVADESGKCLTKFEYDKQNRIVKMHNASGAITPITYTDSLITVGNNKFTINGNTITKVAGTYTDTFNIDKDGYIVSFTDGLKYTYKDGNLISVYLLQDNFTDVYSYDDKKSPLSNSNTPKWLIDRLSLIIGASKNNVVKGIEKSFVYKYKYEYDSDGFPVVSARISVMKEYATTSTDILRFIYRGETQNIDAEVAKLKEEEAELVAAAKQEASQDILKEIAEYIKANSGTFTDPRDKKTYKTIKIGEQVWMAENLNYAAKGSKCGGTVLEEKTQLEIYDSEDGEAETYSKYESYSLVDKNTVNCDKYGRLYEWETAKEACPKGWHLPSNKEWDKLLRYVDDASGTESPYKSETAGKYLKADSGWYDNRNGTNKFGFSALPSGFGNYKSDGGYNSDGDFGGIGNYGNWWNSSDDYYRTINYHNEDGVDYSKGYNGKDLYSVRCIQN